MIKISVIIPVYNTEKYLERCLRSIINQTLKELEIICINDGSTDRSLEILEKFSKEDSRIKIINKENQGVSIARNIGLNLSKGKYVSFVDSDDWVELNFFEDTYKEAEKNNDDIIVVDYFVNYDNTSDSFYKKDGETEGYINKELYLQDMILEKRPGFLWNKLIKKSLFSENRIECPQNIYLAEDLLTLVKLVKNSKRITKVNRAYLHYFQHKNNTCKNIQTKHLKSLLYVFDQILREGIVKKQVIDVAKANYLNWLLYSQEACKTSDESNDILIEYFENIKNLDIKNLDTLKLRIYTRILKIYPKKLTFILIWKINKFLRNIKVKSD